MGCVWWLLYYVCLFLIVVAGFVCLVFVAVLVCLLVVGFGWVWFAYGFCGELVFWFLYAG